MHRGELPCEYLSGLHFSSWDRGILYSDGNFMRAIALGEELPDEEYAEFLKIVELGKKRLKEIRKR
jgi:hypothetical protein